MNKDLLTYLSKDYNLIEDFLKDNEKNYESSKVKNCLIKRIELTKFPIVGINYMNDKICNYNNIFDGKSFEEKIRMNKEIKKNKAKNLKEKYVKYCEIFNFYKQVVEKYEEKFESDEEINLKLNELEHSLFEMKNIYEKNLNPEKNFFLNFSKIN